MRSFSQKVFSLPGFKLTGKRPPGLGFTFTDIPEEKGDKIYLNPDYFGNDGLNHIPLGMQPVMYFKDYYKKAVDFTGRKNRRIGIFFSGNMTEILYERPVINAKFNKLGRLEVYKSIVQNFPESLVVPETEKDLYRADLQHRVVFNNRLQVMIPQNEFLRFLSECSFFLFTPGVTHPICHNNFEAMAVGTIPILQYPEYFYPALEHKKNCLIFNDEKDLVKIIKSALALPEKDVEEMRQNVLEYYNKYLSVESIVKNIMDSHAKGIREFFFGLD